MSVKVQMLRSPRNGRPMMGHHLEGVSRCPFCSIAQPSLVSVWSSEGFTETADKIGNAFWGAYKCENCASIVTAKVENAAVGTASVVTKLIPSARTAHEDIPELARIYLQQAYDTLHAPDAAAVMAGSAIDAMLKEIGYSNGSLYERIDQALKKNVITQGMADWAHEVRLGSNRPRHADAKRPNVSPAEAAQSVEFAEAFGNFLFVLTARIRRGIEAASSVPPTEE